VAKKVQFNKEGYYGFIRGKLYAKVFNEESTTYGGSAG